jgi:putative sporulation protein YyaC
MFECADKRRIPYFLCVGSMKNMLDSVAPRVGSILKRHGYMVLGTEEDNLHAVNIPEKYESVISKIDTEIYQPIAIDACISIYDGFADKITVKERSLKPGAGVGKKLPCFGEYCIFANINHAYKNLSQLQFNAFMFANEKNQSLLPYVNSFVYEIVALIETVYDTSDKKYKAVHACGQVLQGKTLRELVGIKKSTAAYLVHNKLPRLNPKMYKKYLDITDWNFKTKYIKGGQATRRKWKNAS